MAGTRTEMVDGVRITVVEDTREDLQDFSERLRRLRVWKGKNRRKKPGAISIKNNIIVLNLYCTSAN